MLKIWGRTSSSNVMKVMWLCDEIGLPYERIDAGGDFGRTTEPFYLAMNPNSRVPTIDDDGYTLWESNSILRYLCTTRAPDSSLYPRDAKARADVERWMDWQIASLNAPMTTIFFTYVRIPEAQRDYPATEKARAEAERLWSILDAQLAGKRYITGSFSIADIALGIYVNRWFQLPIQRKDLPNLAAWYQQLQGHEGFRRHAMVPMT